MDENINKEISAKIDRFFEILHAAKKLREGTAQAEVLSESLTPAEQESLPFFVPEASIVYLLGEAKLDEMRKHLALLFEDTLVKGVLSETQKSQLLEGGEIQITLRLAPDNEKILNTKDIPTTAEVYELAKNKIPDALARNRDLKKTLLDIFYAVMGSNLVFDGGETQIRRLDAAESVEPLRRHIKKDELLIQRGILISAEQKNKIDQIQKMLRKREALHQWSAIALLVFLSFGFCFACLFCFAKRTLLSFRELFLIHTVLILTVLICKIISVWPGSSLYLMPVALASLLLTLLVNAQLGLMAAAVMAVWAGPLGDFQPDIIFAAFFASTGASFSAIRMRKRIEFIRVGFVVGALIFAVLFAFRLFQDHVVRESFVISSLGFANGLLITVPILFILLPLMEAAFNAATDISLLELSDLNHPLLKRMVIEAPGTYHHSLVVSRLAEAACESIGANALLARVGCYFHDIGKISRPEYFTENQLTQTGNKHDKLTSAMSCRVIINHIKEGVELGKKYKLKECILRFIREHQGNGVVYYFYRKSLDQAGAGEKIDPDDFRYPGPRPQSRETAVALLADSAEAATRALQNPTPDAIRALVRKVINDKFIDGQLDDCDLTLRDLIRIQESFVRNLMAVYHSRVSYPDSPDSPDKPDLFEEGQFHKFRSDPET